MGVVGASDWHDAASTTAKAIISAATDFSTPLRRAVLAGRKRLGLNVGLLSTAGLGGVWAEENTRESIFAAMQRKETFGTSGVRMRVRLFGGWNFRPDVLDQKDWVKAGYANGASGR